MALDGGGEPQRWVHHHFPPQAPHAPDCPNRNRHCPCCGAALPSAQPWTYRPPAYPYTVTWRTNATYTSPTHF